MSSKLHGLVQTEWHWLIAVYLFLAGAGAGAHITAVVIAQLGPTFFETWAPWETLAKAGIFLGWPCVLIGCVCLLLDLGNVMNAWRVARKPDSSWISRGTIIISIFMIVAFIHTVKIATGTDVATLGTIGIIGAIFAFGTMVYTGLLLGDAICIPFWNTVLLPILFFLSAASTGVMLVVLAGTFAGVDSAALHALSTADIIILAVEVLALGAFLHGSYRVPNTRPSAEYVLKDDGSNIFWFGVVLCGIVAPLVLDIVGVMPWAAAILGLAGGLCLRYVVLAAGSLYSMSAAGFEFRPCKRPKQAMPEIGKLPPS